MALTTTTLSGSIKLNDRQLTLAAFTNPSQGAISSPTFLVVDGECMLVTDTTNSPTLGVSRGHASPVPGQPTVTCSAHNTTAPVVYGLASDFTQSIATDGTAGVASFSISTNGTYTLPVVDCVIYINKAGVCAITINGPNKDQVNKVKFVSLTANAHTITYTAGWYGNTTSSDVVTFPSTIGAVWQQTAKNGVWNADVGGGTTGNVTGPA